MGEPDSLEHKRAILEYWTLVEFFSPYILENTLNNKQSYQKIYANEPASLLPWLTAQTIEENDPKTPFAKGYHLYLGLFSVDETADRARHSFTKQPSQWQSVNWRNCAQASSTSAFARLTVTTHGIPLFGTLTLSTLPWAHGRLLDEKKESLTIEQYWKSVNRFLLALREEFSKQLPVKVMKLPKIQAGYLDLDSLFRLTELCFTWAGFKPLGYPLVLIEPLSADATQAAKDPHIKTERDVPILNSFYIQDLEAATISLSSQKGKPLDLYLSEKPESRTSLESEEGKKAILDTVHPQKIPSGRWPDPLSFQQSLMQQFAINATLNSLKEKGIFSVNGPPGTGKTSLLREIIAENIVKRAAALSELKTAQSAFVARHTLSFESSDPVVINELDPSLLGYEMLVVSSNNTAVQNLSKELPLRSQLDPSFHHISYLETVATKALGVKKKEAWGLISATLGNMENCRQFVERVFTGVGAANEEGGSRIWEWIDAYDGPSFVEARDAFISIKNRQEELLSEIERLKFFHDEIKGHTVETYCVQELTAFVDAEDEFDRLNTKRSQLLLDEVQNKELLALLGEREAVLKKEYPGIFSRMVNRISSKDLLEHCSTIRKERIALLDELHRCKTALKELDNQLRQHREKESDITQKLLDQALQFYSYQAAYDRLKVAHPEARLPSSTEALQEKNTHTQSYYQTKEINTARSELFGAAITLHEAWLAETLRPKGGFRQNLIAIANILQGKSPTTADDTRLAWQSVFLLIPVISSTFASVGRLFRHVEPGTLGWVLIDEAGQAVPQSAVGAIWRANRVLSIGDPFQIEPICSIPGEVIDGMAKSKLKDYTLRLAPSQISVQNLMDRASIFGSERTIRDESYWLGSPLRVHRRCLEPMFTIANSIAYENSMLLASQAGKEIPLPPSCWWDVGGRTSDRQYVPQQGDALVYLLKEMFINMDTPDLYIISPFREVIAQIQLLIIGDKEIQEIFKQKFSTTCLQTWVHQAIGTVHTFQGKQASAVFFVLGADRSTLGAITWASRKPNLLNVAVTRAQARFYMIGDYDLWKTWPHFDVAAKKLERRNIVRK